jgi:hypothetical protein
MTIDKLRMELFARLEDTLEYVPETRELLGVFTKSGYANGRICVDAGIFDQREIRPEGSPLSNSVALGFALESAESLSTPLDGRFSGKYKLFCGMQNLGNSNLGVDLSVFVPKTFGNLVIFGQDPMDQFDQAQGKMQETVADLMKIFQEMLFFFKTVEVDQRQCWIGIKDFLMKIFQKILFFFKTVEIDQRQRWIGIKDFDKICDLVKANIDRGDVETLRCFSRFLQEINKNPDTFNARLNVKAIGDLNALISGGRQKKVIWDVSHKIGQILEKASEDCSELYKRLSLIASDEAVRGKVLAILDEIDRVGYAKFIRDKIAAKDYTELGSYLQFFHLFTWIEKFVEPSNDSAVAAIEKKMKDEMGIDVAFGNDTDLAGFVFGFFQRLSPKKRELFPKKLVFFENPDETGAEGFILPSEYFAGIENNPIYLRKNFFIGPPISPSSLAVNTPEGTLVHELGHYWNFCRKGICSSTPLDAFIKMMVDIIRSGSVRYPVLAKDLGWDDTEKSPEKIVDDFMKKIKEKVSSYALTNIDEFVAEMCSVLACADESKRKGVTDDPEIMTVFLSVGGPKKECSMVRRLLATPQVSPVEEANVKEAGAA